MFLRAYLLACILAAVLLAGLDPIPVSADDCPEHACSGSVSYSTTLPCDHQPEPCPDLELQAVLAAVSEASQDCDPGNDCFCVGETSSDCTKVEIAPNVCKYTAVATHIGRCEVVE